MDEGMEAKMKREIEKVFSVFLKSVVLLFVLQFIHTESLASRPRSSVELKLDVEGTPKLNEIFKLNIKLINNSYEKLTFTFNVSFDEGKTIPDHVEVLNGATEFKLVVNRAKFKQNTKIPETEEYTLTLKIKDISITKIQIRAKEFPLWAQASLYTAKDDGAVDLIDKRKTLKDSKVLEQKIEGMRKEIGSYAGYSDFKTAIFFYTKEGKIIPPEKGKPVTSKKEGKDYLPFIYIHQGVDVYGNMLYTITSKDLQKARSVLEQIDGNKSAPEHRAVLHNNLGIVYLLTDEWSKAKKEFIAAANLFDQNYKDIQKRSERNMKRFYSQSLPSVKVWETVPYPHELLNFHIHLNLMLLYVIEGDLKSAKEAMDKAQMKRIIKGNSTAGFGKWIKEKLNFVKKNKIKYEK